MEANPTLIINYFSGFKQNLVPLFQRPYTWGEKQWRTLWDDILSFYDADLTSRASTHFMGAVVTMPARSVPVGVSKFMIIDGQQCLTTIALLMCAIRDSFGEQDQIHRRRIQNFYLTNEGYQDSDFFKLLPTQGDRAAYAPLVKDTVAASPASQFKKAYDFFRRRLGAALDDGIEVDPKRILEILEMRLMVVMINLSDTDDPYLIFESLNFKGSPLEQADLVRNYFLMRFPVSEQQVVYDQLWLPMQNRLGGNLTEFMRHFLGSEGHEVRKTDVYAAIKKLVADSDPPGVRAMMTRMERLSVLYCRLSALAPEPGAALSRYFDHFRRLDFGSVYPLLLALYQDYDEGHFGIEEFSESLRVLHSFILRRMVAGVPSNQLSTLFITLCRARPVTETPSSWLATSLAKEDKNRRWPSDSEFEDRWLHAPLYGSRACQVILECIEEDYGHHEAVPFEEATVEHVMPQTLTPEWEALLGRDVGYHSEWLHTIGNLTVTGYNPELSNKPYPEKRTTYALSHFELNRYFGAAETWGIDAIKLRAQKLFRAAIRLWPRPPILVASTASAEEVDLTEENAPAAFHGNCVRLVEGKLGIHLSKLSQTKYESGERDIRVICAVSAEHTKKSDIPYFWFAFHSNQLEFLKAARDAWICFGCGSPQTTLLIPLAVIRDCLDSLSVRRTDDRCYWHVVVQKKQRRFMMRLLDSLDGPDLTEFNIGEETNAA